MAVVHHGWETTYPECNDVWDWGTTCGLEEFENFSTNWSNVTCKKCLKQKEIKDRKKKEDCCD